MDHAQDPAAIRHAADSGFYDSIMVDMSHYEKEENLDRTRELTAYCHERGIATEAEPGRIEGGEDGISDTVDLEGLLTSPEEAEEFVDTGIDWLAPAFGNVHGSYGERGIQLDYERLEKINEKVGGKVQLVLHGTDGWDKEIFGKCIERGATKVNINKVVNRQYTELQKEGKLGLTALMEEGTRRMQEQVEICIEQLGSAGKA
jgi:fructose-bisphosphate aldolase class II